MNEAETRAEHIDPALKAAGWGVVEGSRVRREVITLGRIQGGGKRGKQDIADYVLEYRNRKLAVVEAKKWDSPYTEGLGQAKHYAQKLTTRFAYSTNGQRIYGVDMDAGKEGDVAAFPSPDQLWNRIFGKPNEWRDKFAAIPFHKSAISTPRYYQEIAINRALDAMAGGRDRILLTLATGTGKTEIAFQIAWKLFHSRWNLRRCKYIKVSSILLRGWFDQVIPLAVELVSLQIDLLHLLVGHFAPDRIFSSIQSARNLQALRRRRRSNQVDDRLIVPQWLTAPIG